MMPFKMTAPEIPAPSVIGRLIGWTGMTGITSSIQNAARVE